MIERPDDAGFLAALQRLVWPAGGCRVATAGIATGQGAVARTAAGAGIASRGGSRSGTGGCGNGSGTAAPAGRRFGVPAWGLMLGLLLAGCADAPVVRWHSLLAPPGSTTAPQAPVEVPVGSGESAPAAVAPLVVDLSITRVPAEVEQPQWLVRLPDDTLRLLESERWAAPLRDELRAALMQALIARWGVADARSRPPESTIDAIRDALPAAAPPAAPAQPASGRTGANRPLPAPARPGDAPTAVPADQRRVTVDVTRFESLPDREARLETAWAVTATGAAQQIGEPPMPMPVLACRSAFREPVGSGAPALAAGHRRAVAALADAIGRTLRAGRGAVCPPDGSSS